MDRTFCRVVRVSIVYLPGRTDVILLFRPGRSKRGKNRGPPGSKDWSQALKNCDDPLFIDFIKRCLEWDPLVRLTPAQALRYVLTGTSLRDQII